MSLVLTVAVNGVPVAIELGDEQLADFAAALRIPTQETTWPEWLDAFRAADYLGISVERVRKLKDRGEIPYYQEGPGCRVFFHRPELDAWMQTFRIEHREEGTPRRRPSPA